MLDTKNGIGGISNIRKNLPPVVLPNGAVYTGEWKDGMRDGKGIQEWPDGSRYIG
jgi:hypothetical protein